MSKLKFLDNRTQHRLILGELYLVSTSKTKHHTCKLVKVTPNGYNMLDINTNKCVLYPHLYPNKNWSTDELLVVYAPIWISINKIKLTSTG